MYAKFINETTIKEAPAQFELNERKYVGFTDEFLLAQGYKPVVYTPKNEKDILDESASPGVDNTDKVFQCYYVDNETEIVQRWRLVSASS